MAGTTFAFGVKLQQWIDAIVGNTGKALLYNTA